jgi:hypothetical protein
LGFGFYGHQMIENFTGSFTIPNSIYWVGVRLLVYKFWQNVLHGNFIILINVVKFLCLEGVALELCFMYIGNKWVQQLLKESDFSTLTRLY